METKQVAPSSSDQSPQRFLDKRTVVRWVTWAFRIVSFGSLVTLALALRRYATVSDAWFGQLAVFAATATLPQFAVDRLARLSESVAQDSLPSAYVERGLANLGAWVGIIERPLLLGAIIGGFPEFVAGWYVLKGVTGFRIGLDKDQVKERRAFQVFLINNGLSFAGVGLGWVLWKLMQFPTY